MNTKLTLRLDDRLIAQAKTEAARRGKSVSQMVAEFSGSLNEQRAPKESVTPPLTSSLFGVLKRPGLDEADYRRHLRSKHL